MVWARIDDEILDNEKITNAGALGFALNVAAITWCCRNLTDGFVPRAKVRALLDFEGLYSADGAAVEWAEVAKRCVDAGLWIEDQDRGGFWIHDFLEYNFSREKVISERERGKVRAGKSAATKKGAGAKSGTKPQPPVPFGGFAGSSPEVPAKIRSGFAGSSPDLRNDFGSASHGPDPEPVPVKEPPTGRAPELGLQRLLRPDEPLTDQRRKDFATLTEQTAPRPIDADWAQFVDDRIGRTMLFGSEGAIDADWRKWTRRENGYATKRRIEAQNAPQRRGKVDTRQPLIGPEPEWLVRAKTGTGPKGDF